MLEKVGIFIGAFCMGAVFSFIIAYGYFAFNARTTLAYERGRIDALAILAPQEVQAVFARQQPQKQPEVPPQKKQ